MNEHDNEEELKNEDPKISSQANVENKNQVKNINDIMSREILRMMKEPKFSKIIDKIKKKNVEDSFDDLDQNLEHASLFKDDNH